MAMRFQKKCISASGKEKECYEMRKKNKKKKEKKE